MNRQIKFRGMDANGVMRYGRLSQDAENSTLYYKDYSQRICWDSSNIPVRNESLGQFTGLLDKSGKEIYEGDVVQHIFSNQVFPVVFKDGKFCRETSQGLENPYWEDCEIIGNIYENQELLSLNIKG